MKKETILIKVVHKNDIYHFNKFSQLEKFISNKWKQVKELEENLESFLANFSYQINSYPQSLTSKEHLKKLYIDELTSKEHLKKLYIDEIKFLQKMVITIGKN
jgi:hypothetical protein